MDGAAEGERMKSAWEVPYGSPRLRTAAGQGTDRTPDDEE